MFITENWVGALPQVFQLSLTRVKNGGQVSGQIIYPLELFLSEEI